MRSAVGEPVCSNCAAIFPNDWPRDRVVASKTLSAVDAARQVLVFTRILHGIRLDKLHDECIVDSINWLRSLRAASRTLKVVGVPHKLLDVWMEMLHGAQEALQFELRERPHVMAPAPNDIRRALRTAMSSVGWDDFGVSIDPDGRRIRILYAAEQEEARLRRRAAFAAKLREQLGEDAFERLEVRFRQLDD